MNRARPSGCCAIPGFKVGKTGVEVAREQDLRGSGGALKIEGNPAGA